MKRTLVILVSLLAMSRLVQAQTGATVVPVQHDESTALSSRPVDMPHGKGKPEITAHRVKQLPPLPPRPFGKAGVKGVVQKTASKALDVVAPGGFPGIGDGKGYSVDAVPSDTTGSIGSKQYVQWVNEALQVFDRDGNSVYGPTLGRSLWSKFDGPCQNLNDGDPIVQYDKVAGRWVLSQFAVNDGEPFSECVAVSETDDATGKYFRYAFSFDKFNDYPKFGIWPDAYYVTFNMFDGDTPLGSKICALNREKMMAGQDAPVQCFDTPEFGLLPADVDGTTPPPAGSPAYAMNLGTDSLNLWQIKIDWNDPTKSRFTGPVQIPVAPFDIACATAPCIPQKAPGTKLQALGDRLMYRLVYRNFGDHESLLLNHSVRVNDQSKPASAIRWYEIRDPQTAPKLAQASTYAVGTTFARWIGSAAMDKKGNLLIGYSASSSSISPAIRLAGRKAADPLNLLSKEVNIASGKNVAQGGRWGDYSNMSLDPLDDCTFWFTTEFMGETNKSWQTRVVHTKFNDCK
jgi:hypothetical protein